MKKLLIVLSGIISSVLLFLVGVYFFLAQYYKGGFSYNTWINGVYCTGKSVETVNEELKVKYETRYIEVQNPDGTVEYILPDEINYRIDFTDYLNEIIDSQNPYLWIKNFSDWHQNIEASPVFSYDEYALNETVNNLSFVKNNLNTGDYKVEIRKGDKGYYLYDNHRPYVDINKVYENVKVALYSEGPFVITDDYLLTPEYTSKEKRAMEEWEFVSSYLEPKLTLDMGAEQILIDEEILSSFIKLESDGTFRRNEDGSLFIDENAVVTFIDDLCSSYDTYDKDRVFITSNGEEKIIKNVYYGTLLNHSKEIAYFKDAILNQIAEVHTPEYIRKGYVRGLDDIGLTYIEVDMGEQVLYYYEDGVLSLKTDIVSGKPNGNSTPQMICSIYNKKRNAILRGPGYASPVDYWMAVYQGIGLHDSNWQRKYGGDWYVTHGSHGCINMKLNAVSYIYDTAEVGTPVILYY